MRSNGIVYEKDEKSGDMINVKVDMEESSGRPTCSSKNADADEGIEVQLERFWCPLSEKHRRRGLSDYL